MCIEKIGGIVGALTGVASLLIVVYDKIKKGAKIKAVLRNNEFDGQTQKESRNREDPRDVHYCVFQFSIRLDNSGNDICTLTDIEVESGYDGHERPEIDLETDDLYLQIPAGTPGFFSCENRLIYEGAKPVFPISLKVTMHFIGHRPIVLSIQYDNDGKMFF